MKKYPYMAHNAAFEDSWFKIHLDGYAEARRAGKIIVTDSRQICRSLDADVRSLPANPPPPRSRTGRAAVEPSPPTPTSSIWAWTTPTSCSAPSKPSSTSRTYLPSRNVYDKHGVDHERPRSGNPPQRGRPTFHK